MFAIFKNWRRKRILAQPFPPHWRELLEQNIWQFRSLSEQQKTRVEQCTAVMIAEKHWESVDNLVVTDAMKITIVGTASLLTLGLDEPFYFDKVRTIILYPGLIRNRQLTRGLVVQDEDSYYSGMAWQNGPLLFSWPNALRGSRRTGEGSNVIIHEFVHHIDGLDGEMGGTPYIASTELRDRWKTVFTRRYRELVSDIEAGRRPRLRPYAGKNLAEFLAVASESFFDAPDRLRDNLPDVYDVLSEFFDIRPTEFKIAS